MKNFRYVKDSQPAMLIALIIMIFPAQNPLKIVKDKSRGKFAKYTANYISVIGTHFHIA